MQAEPYVRVQFSFPLPRRPGSGTLTAGRSYPLKMFHLQVPDEAIQFGRYFVPVILLGFLGSVVEVHFFQEFRMVLELLVDWVYLCDVFFKLLCQLLYLFLEIGWDFLA